jgi:hypothetical protein
VTVPWRGALSAAVVLALLLGWPLAAHAHQVGLSRGEYLLTGNQLDVELTFAQRDLATSFPGLDEHGKGHAILGGLRITSGDATCPFERTRTITTVGEDTIIKARAICPSGARDVELVLGFLPPFPAGHRHLAHVRGGRADQESVLLPSANVVRIDTGSPIVGARGDTAWSFVRLGIEHILTGYDHLVFLLGLVLIGGRPRALMKAITAFTVAHSLSLALAVLGLWTPSPRFIEPAIALSIAYVGVENFFVNDAESRWRVTLPFGFIHGFGFAGALVERHLPRPRIPLALLGFNSGVELGQLAMVALVLPLVVVGHRYPVVRTRAVPTANAMVVVLGLGWLALRIRDAFHAP